MPILSVFKDFIVNIITTPSQQIKKNFLLSDNLLVSFKKKLRYLLK